MNTDSKFRVKEEDLEKIKKRAASTGMSTSDFVREAVLDGWIAQFDTVELNKLVWEVNKIGVNINQLVKLCNQSGFVSPSTAERIESLQKEALELLLQYSSMKDKKKLIKII